MGLLGGKALADGVKQNHNLAVLDVTGNDVPEEYVAAIDSVILRNRDNVLFREREQLKAKTLENQVFSMREEHEKYVSNLHNQLNKARADQQVPSLILYSDLIA